MKRNLTIVITTLSFILFYGSSSNAQDIADGESNFKLTCAACHSIGKGRLVGPDLANIEQRQPEEWIIKFVKSSQSVINSGDKYADSLFQAFNKVIMPDQPTLTDNQIKNIIAYIKNKSGAPSSTTSDNAQPVSDQNAVKKESGTFSTTTLLLLGLIVIMLMVIIYLSRINKKLLDQIKDFYSSDKSFFKK